MVEEILDNVFRLEVPLPKNPLKLLNSYLIKGSPRSLLIDTGFNRTECREALDEGIKTLGLNWSEIDFFITHMHGDHAGLIQTLAREESVVYCSDVDAGVIQAAKTSAYWEQVYSFLSAQGFPAEDLEKHSSMVTSYFAEQDNERLTHVNEGDVLAVGGYLLTCVSTPGHTPGHMCLYEPKHKFLIAGDHILANITSNITYWPFFHDSLGWYLRSLHKIDLMDIDLVLPGHRNIINDCHERIAELELHHQNRLEEALGILRQGPMNGYQVASQMHWDMPHDDWAQVPSFQKWFATGEAIAHLEHLAEQGLVQAIRQDNRMTYKLM